MRLAAFLAAALLPSIAAAAGATIEPTYAGPPEHRETALAAFNLLIQACPLLSKAPIEQVKLGWNEAGGPEAELGWTYDIEALVFVRDQQPIDYWIGAGQLPGVHMPNTQLATGFCGMHPSPSAGDYVLDPFPATRSLFR